MMQLNAGGDQNPRDSDSLKKIQELLDGVLDVNVNSSALPVGAASVAMQQAIFKQLQNTASSVWTDNTGAYYIRRDNVDSDTGAVTVAYTTPTGDAATPGAGLKPASAAGGGASSSKFELVSYWLASAAGAGYSAGDTLAKIVVLDASTSPPTIALTAWENVATGALLAATPSNIVLQLGNAQRTYNITAGEVAAGASLTIPAGKQQIDVANIGTANATIKSASMGSATNLYPVSLGGASLSFRSADAGTLEALTITCPAGAQVQYTMTE